jgi:hypothetical protein
MNGKVSAKLFGIVVSREKAMRELRMEMGSKVGYLFV